MSKHMLLIGGSREVHPKAKKLGFRLCMLFDMKTVKSRKGLDMYDRIVGIPARASAAEWVATARLIHATDPFDCIGGFNEPTQDFAAAIAEALGLPFHTTDVIRYTKQKDIMRQLLTEAGLNSAASRLVQNATEVEGFAAAHGYPVVLKPVDGRGSLSVAILHTQAEIAPAVERFRQAAPGHQMLVEQFLDGSEWSVEAFSEAGKHKIVCITQKFKDPVSCVETGHCLPAPLAEAPAAAIRAYVRDVLTAVGIQNGPSHTEVILTASGPQIVETHARLAGDSIVELIELASGVDLDDAWIRQCGGESVLGDIPEQLGRFASIAYVTPAAVGTLVRIDGESEAKALPGVIRVDLLQDPGAKMEGATDSFARGASAIAIGERAEEATSRAKDAAGRLSFVLACR